MFPKEFSKFSGVDLKANWYLQLQNALNNISTQKTTESKDLLSQSIDLWDKASELLMADLRFNASEKYCIRQSYLCQMMDIIKKRFPLFAVSRIIFPRAKKVFEDTPAAARPIDQAFLAGDNVIHKTLLHLHVVNTFYQPFLHPNPVVAAVPMPDLPVSSDGFKCTYVAKPDLNQAITKHFWESFLKLNTMVRICLIGNEAQAKEAVQIIDPISNQPGAGLAPGRCIWFQIPDAIRPELEKWLKDQGNNNLDEIRCIFIKKTGKLSSVLKKSDIIDFVAVADEYLNANL